MAVLRFVTIRIINNIIITIAAAKYENVKQREETTQLTDRRSVKLNAESDAMLHKPDVNRSTKTNHLQLDAV